MSGVDHLPRRGRTADEPVGSRVGRSDASADSALVLATRGSALALAQARLVGEALTTADPGIVWRILPITTRGDRDAGAGSGDATSAKGVGLAPVGPGPVGRDIDPAPEAGSGRNGRTDGGGRSDSGPGTGGHDESAPDETAAGSRLAAMARVAPGVFTSEVAAAVVRGEAAAAVHSLKDLPLDDHDGLHLAAMLPRAAPGDVLVVAPDWFDATARLGLRHGAVVGTSSPRRAALLRHFAPQVRVVEMRGNVPTRLRRCGAGEVAAVVLAQAGLQRLGAGAHGLLTLPLPAEHWQPAPGQGAVAVQTRRTGAAADLVAAIDHAATRTAVTLERAVLRALGGGCAAACGAYARPLGDREWELHYGFAAPGVTWRSYHLQASAAVCRSALDAWAAGGPSPGRELPAVAAQKGAAQKGIAAVSFGAT